MNQFTKYAQKYSCSVSQAIADRDWPMNRDQCVQAFKEAMNRQPTEAEITEMKPDNEKTMKYQVSLEDWENFDVGRR